MHAQLAFTLALAVGLALASTAAAAPLGKLKEGAKPAPAAASGATAAPTMAPHVRTNAIPATFTLPGIPAWQPPAEYSVDMVMSSGDQTVTMHRIFRNGSIRSDIAAEGETMSMIEKADEPGTTYTLMPSQKMAMKMSADDVNPALAKAAKEHRLDPDPQPEAQPEIEKLGTETIDGRAATRFKVTAGEHHALMWFDSGTGAPLKMESEGSKIEWKNLEVKSQPASLFEVPKGYQVTDMGEMQKKMQAAMTQGGMAMGGAGMTGRMGAGAAMSALGAGGGLPGGGASLEGMAGGYGQQMGQNFGQQIGSSIGASFGGPIGAMAGSYISGKVGGWLGHRVATAVTPDIGPGASK